MTTAQPPLGDANATLIARFGDPGATSSASPGPSPETRYDAGNDWQVAAGSGGAEGVAVHPIGAGTILAAGTLDQGRGGIVVVEHTGQLFIPAPAAGARFAYQAELTDRLLSVYRGLTPAAELGVGMCVDAQTTLGTVGATCQDVAASATSCAVAPLPLHLELRLAGTADPAARSADWSTVGAAEDSVNGLFRDAQRMVDDGLRDPLAFIDAMAAASPAPSASPTPSPSSKPIIGAKALVLAGVPETIRASCTPRTASLITGTLAAVDCAPDDPAIRQLSYYLLRPADAKFVFASRMRQHGAKAGADCHAGKAGIESKSAKASVGCFVDSAGRANLRFVTRTQCPAIYVGVLGSGRSIADLAAAYDRTVGGMWRDPGSHLAACRSGNGSVSRPPAPTDVAFKVKGFAWTGEKQPDYRLTVTWAEQVEADTTIEVYAVHSCPARDTKRDHSCLGPRPRIPRSSLSLQASAPAADGTVSWMVPGWEEIGGPVGYDKDGKDMWAVVVRAVNAHGASRYVVAKDGNGFICSDCVY